jgi:hypothetical protein
MKLKKKKFLLESTKLIHQIHDSGHEIEIIT